MSKFVHMELNTSNPNGAKKFYEGVFGWKYQDMPMPNGIYSMINAASEPIGGMQQNPMPSAPSHWLAYAAVKSVARTVGKVEDLGGQVLVPKTDIPGIGSFSVLADPQGAPFAVWEEAEKAKAAPKKKATKKRTAKKATKKRAAKKSTKRATKKQPARKATKKRAAKKTTRKATKRTGATKRGAAKKRTAKKRTAKKRTAKKSTHRRR